MKYCAMKEIDSLVKGLIRQGWSFHKGSKHGRLRAPCGQPILTVPVTPSDHRAFLNFRRDVRQALAQPLFVDHYADNRATGAFIVIDESNKNTVGAGMIL